MLTTPALLITLTVPSAAISIRFWLRVSLGRARAPSAASATTLPIPAAKVSLCMTLSCVLTPLGQRANSSHFIEHLLLLVSILQLLSGNDIFRVTIHRLARIGDICVDGAQVIFVSPANIGRLLRHSSHQLLVVGSQWNWLCAYILR